MRIQPDGAELLKAAQELLREILTGQAVSEHKHALLMIANAISIAERQLRAGDAHERQELASLEQLLGQSMPAEQGELKRSLLLANRVLAQRIREGAADPCAPLGDAIRSHLLVTTRQRVLESNPKYLK